MFETSVVRGLIALVIGLMVTAVMMVLAPTPWSMGQVMIAVGSASFAGVFATSYYHQQGQLPGRR